MKGFVREYAVLRRQREERERRERARELWEGRREVLTRQLGAALRSRAPPPTTTAYTRDMLLGDFFEDPSLAIAFFDPLPKFPCRAFPHNKKMMDGGAGLRTTWPAHFVFFFLKVGY